MTRLESRAGAIQLQDFQYDYEDRGLLTRRVDGLLGRSDELVYDELRHLRTLGERGAAVRERYSMDEIGNLTATHDGELHYLDPAHPYAATEIDGPNGGSFRYDAVGNAYRARDLEIAYTQRNLPRTIDSDKTGIVRYTYDAGGGRASKRGRDTDITYFGLYELERRGMQLYERLSIDTPVGVVAQVERGAQSGPNGPGSRLRWLLVERQGSVETTWVSGESPQHIQYDAYGGVLTSGGSASGERPGATVSQGYTSHEHEDDVELINMGGRVYSPRLRRFLTADPVVANPVGQGLNAYTYVRGNPTNAIDPFGWQEYSAEDAALDAIPDEDLPTFYGKAVVPAGDSPTSERAGAGAAGQGSVADPMATLTDWGNRYAGFTETLFNFVPNAVPENELSPARWVHAASEWALSRNGSEVDLFNRRSREYGQGEIAALALLLYAPVVGPLYAEQNAAGHAAAMTGEVVYRPPADMPAAERALMRQATEAFEAERQAGHLHPDGRQRTRGTTREAADRDVRRERARAERAGEPYQGGREPHTRHDLDGRAGSPRRVHGSADFGQLFDGCAGTPLSLGIQADPVSLY